MEAWASRRRRLSRDVATRQRTPSPVSSRISRRSRKISSGLELIPRAVSLFIFDRVSSPASVDGSRSSLIACKQSLSAVYLQQNLRSWDRRNSLDVDGVCGFFPVGDLLLLEEGFRFRLGYHGQTIAIYILLLLLNRLFIVKFV